MYLFFPNIIFEAIFAFAIFSSPIHVVKLSRQALEAECQRWEAAAKDRVPDGPSDADEVPSRFDRFKDFRNNFRSISPILFVCWFVCAAVLPIFRFLRGRC